MIKTILVPVSGSDADAAVFATALALARVGGGHLRFLHFHLSIGEAVVYAPHVEFCRGAALADALESVRQKGDKVAASALEHCRDFCETHRIAFQDEPGADGAVSGSWMVETYDAMSRLLFHARHSDAIVVGRMRKRALVPDGMIQAALLRSGRPVIIAGDSQTPDRFGTVVVGWKETAEASRALTSALPVLEGAKRVILLGIPEHGAASLQALEDLSRQLTWHSIAARVHVAPERAGPAGTRLTHAAVELGADLLVVGAFGHGQFREEVFGGVTQSLLESANFPVLMMH